MINEKTDEDEIDDLDWEFLKLLIRSGMISVKSNPRIISFAISAQRVDILSELLRFASDINEDQCLFLMTYPHYFPSILLVLSMFLSPFQT